MSRLVRTVTRERTMQLAAAGGVKVLVSSDNMARGIDLSNIDLVINYDPPKHARTYVHRVGRTARAGRSGHAVTFVRKGQQGTFSKTRALVDARSVVDDGKDKNGTSESARPSARLKRSKVKASTVDEVRQDYSAALRGLAGLLRLEQTNVLRPDDPLPSIAAENND
jgi:superfamily II DNA/RNA helicase